MIAKMSIESRQHGWLSTVIAEPVKLRRKYPSFNKGVMKMQADAASYSKNLDRVLFHTRDDEREVQNVDIEHRS